MLGLKLFQCGRNRTALCMAEDDDQACAEARSGEFDAADLLWRHHIAGHADHKQIAEPLIKDDLNRNARV